MRKGPAKCRHRGYREPRFVWLVAVALGAVTALSVQQGVPGRGGTLSNHEGATPTMDSSAGSTPGLQLGGTVSPAAICADENSTCPAGAAVARVTLSASTSSLPLVAWPEVQVAFVVEETPYDGVYNPSADDPGYDPCATAAAGGSTACEESNSVPFFVANAQSIASAISVANPHTNVSFAMVDYFATPDDWDNEEAPEYHIDVPQFLPGSEFGGAVRSTYQNLMLNGQWYYQASDFSNNLLHSSSISALYGTLIGSGLDWSTDTHHVIVWIGSTSPRDPSYPENYCVSSSSWVLSGDFGCIAQTCEPSFQFGAEASPNCEGWVRSQNGNPEDSIAELARSTPQCTESLGGSCTIDTVDVWTTPTDPYSQGWPTQFTTKGGGPGGVQVVQDVEHVIEAGCDLAAATSGSWAGPAWTSCPDGAQGSLQYVPHGSASSPNTANPTLLAALSQISFGPVKSTEVAEGGSRPIFQFVPFGNIAPAPDLQATAACLRMGFAVGSCQRQPNLWHAGNLEYLAWNWSTDPTQNTMLVGDSWTASFNVIATGPPYAFVPVDACITQACSASGSGPISELYTWATFLRGPSDTLTFTSFPLVRIHVEEAPQGSLPVTTSLPAPPPQTAIPAAPVLPPLGSPVPVSAGPTGAFAAFSIQAVAAGLLSAGFMRIGIRSRTVAMRVGVLGPASRSRSHFAGPTGREPPSRFG